MRILKESFNAGEFTPRLYSRYELDRFKNGCKTLTNFIPLPQGPVTRRPGTEYIGAVKTAAKFTRLIPFEFSEDDSYILEFGHQYIRFYKNSGQLQAADANTVLLLHLDGAENTTAITDSGSTVHTMTAVNDAKLKTAQKKFGTASCYFDGATDSITCPDHADFNFAATEFTIDLQFRPSATGQNCFYSQEDAASVHDHILFYYDLTSDTIYFSVWDGGARVTLQKAENAGLAADTWAHIMLVRGWGSVTDDWAICVDGASVATFTAAITMPDHDQVVRIGDFGSTTKVVDLGGTGHPFTFSNNAVLSTTASKFGKSSLYFDGTTDYLSAPDHADWDITTNWTVDLFVKHVDHVGSENYISQHEDNDNNWALFHAHGSGLRFVVYSATALVVDTGSGGEIVDTLWHHVAVCKVGDEYGVYKDGVQVAHVSDASTDTFAGSLYLGTYGGTNDLAGYMNNVRIQTSNVFTAAPVAGLTDTITVPTAYSVPDANTNLLLHCDRMGTSGHIDEFRVSTTERQTANFTPATSQYPGGDNSATTYEIATTYIEEDLPYLYFVQSADTMYIVHEDYVVRKLTRSGDVSWAIANVSFTNAPAVWSANDYPRSVDFYEDRLTFGGSPDQPDTIWTSDSSDYTNFHSQASITGTTIALVNSNPDTITDSGNGFVTAGFVANMPVTISNSTADDDTYTIATVTAGTITLIAADTLTGEAAGKNITLAGGASADDDAITMTLLARRVNDIKWISGGRRLLIGTGGEEWWAAGPSDSEPITPSDKIAKRDSSWGSERIMPVNIGDVVFYVQQNGKSVREIVYNYDKDKYVSTDLNILSEHLTRDYSITSMAYQQHPYQILWCVRSDGTALALTYLKEHKVYGWSKHTSGSGEFESVAVISGDPEDEVWFVVKRTVDGSTVRYIEKLKDFNYGTSLSDAFYVDSGLTYDGAAATTISGLSHLEGESVAILADGLVVTGKTVASGALTLSTAASKVHIGLANTPEFETLDTVTQDDEGTLQGVLKRITNITMRLISSMGGLFGPSSSVTDSIPYRDTTTPYTGWTADLSFDEGFDQSSTVYIKCDEPLPLEIAAIMIELEDE